MRKKRIFMGFSRERLLKIGIFILGFGGFIIFLTKTSLFIAQSESVDGKVFLVLKGSSWNKGDLVGITNFELWDQCVMPRLLKKVRGVAGDKVWVLGDEIFINGERIGPIFKKTSTGRSLNTIVNPLVNLILEDTSPNGSPTGKKSSLSSLIIKPCKGKPPPLVVD